MISCQYTRYNPVVHKPLSIVFSQSKSIRIASIKVELSRQSKLVHQMRIESTRESTNIDASVSAVSLSLRLLLPSVILTLKSQIYRTQEQILYLALRNKKYRRIKTENISDNKKPARGRFFKEYMGWTMGLEPTTTGITIQDSTD